MEKVYNFLKSENGRKIILSGRKAVGITEALQQACERNAAFILTHTYEASRLLMRYIEKFLVCSSREKCFLNILYE